MSSLAKQLSALQSNGVSGVTDRKQQQKIHSISLIFDKKVAAGQDFDTIYQVGLEGLHYLETLDNRFQEFERSLFSEASIGIDRLVQTSEQNEALDRAVDSFLCLVSSRLSLTPAIKALEWLVRRFQIHVHNSEALILAALPYFNEEVFLRILDTVPELPRSFLFLKQAKAVYKNPNRDLLVRAYARDSVVFGLINAHVIKCAKKQFEYPLLLAFWSSTSILALMQLKDSHVSDDDIIGQFLPTLSTMISSQVAADCQISAYMILLVLVSQTDLETSIVEATMRSIVLNYKRKAESQALQLMTQLSHSLTLFSEDLYRELVAKFKPARLVTELVQFAKKHSSVKNFCTVLSLSVLTYDSSHSSIVENLLFATDLDKDQSQAIISKAVEVATRENSSQRTPEQLVSLIEKISLSPIFYSFLEKAIEENKTTMETLELSVEISLSKKIIPADNESTEFVANDVTEKTDIVAIAHIEDLPVPNNSFLSASSDFSLRLPIAIAEYKSTKEIDVKSLAASHQISFLARLPISDVPSSIRTWALKKLANSFENADYQGLIPLLIYLLNDNATSTRVAALDVLDALSAIPASKEVWGIDNIYGEVQTEHVKWLPRAQTQTVVEALVGEREEVMLDSNRVILVLREIFSNAGRNKGKLVDFFASHAVAVEFPHLKTFLLHSLTGLGVSPASFLSLQNDWLSQRHTWQQRCAIEGASFSSLERSVFDTAIDKSSIKFLEECLMNSETYAFASSQLEKIWDGLKVDTQTSVVKDLVEKSIEEMIDVLGDLNISETTFSALLKDCNLSTTTNDGRSPGPAKRRRRSSTTSRQALQQGQMASVAEKHLRKTTLILELLEQAGESAADPSILEMLFSLLSDIYSLGHDSELPVEYSEQILANCMIAQVDGLSHKPNYRKLDPSSIRVDIAVSAIRTSSSPQVQNRLLWIVSKLAKLAPETVLHSVMPIFTFMGANTVRQDDEFSAHVIQQTIQNVIPVLKSSLQDVSDSNQIDLLILSFVTAFAHIPRHRRKNLFKALVSTLGVENSLSKLLILFEQKGSESKKKSDSAAYLHFLSKFIQGFSAIDQLRAFNAYIESGSPLYFLREIVASEVEHLQRLVLENYESSNGDQLSELFAKLVDKLLVSSDKDGAALFELILEIQPFEGLVNVLGELSGESQVRAMSILPRRLGQEDVNDKSSQQTVSKTVDAVFDLLDTKPSDELISLCLQSLDVAIRRFGAHIDISRCVTLSVEYLQAKDVDVFISSISALSSACNALGVKMIGYLPKIVPVALSRVEDVEGDNDDINSIELAVFALLGVFIKKIPAFMTSYLDRTLILCFKCAGKHWQFNVLEEIIDIIVVNVQNSAIIKSLSATWKSAVALNEAAVDFHLSTLDAIVASMEKKDVSSQAQSVVGLLIDYLSVREEQVYSDETHLSENDVNRIESRAVSSALRVVMKLNDKSFRPQFVRILRWAEERSSPERLIPFFKLLGKIVATLKSIVTSYYSYVCELACESLEKFSKNMTLTRAILNSLVTSFTYDHIEFWQSQARFDRVNASLSQLMKVEVDSSITTLISKATVALAVSCSSPTYYHAINDKLMSHLKESANFPSHEKLVAIKTLKMLYDRLGEEWVTMLPQLVPIIAELLEDDDEDVESEVKDSLIPSIEEVLGESLDRYLA